MHISWHPHIVQFGHDSAKLLWGNTRKDHNSISGRHCLSACPDMKARFLGAPQSVLSFGHFFLELFASHSLHIYFKVANLLLSKMFLKVETLKPQPHQYGSFITMCSKLGYPGSLLALLLFNALSTGWRAWFEGFLSVLKRHHQGFQIPHYSRTQPKNIYKEHHRWMFYSSKNGCSALWPRFHSVIISYFRLACHIFWLRICLSCNEI